MMFRDRGVLLDIPSVSFRSSRLGISAQQTERSAARIRYKPTN